MGKRQFKLECMSSSSVNIVTKGWYTWVVTEVVYDLETLTHVLGAAYAPPEYRVEVGPDS